jgi:hypothetical protein
MSGNLERRYRRVLRLLPGYYRDRWEEDMVAAFLDSWLTGDPEADEYITRVAGPSGAEVASVAGLAIRLYLGGAGAPRRYFAWGQAIRGAVLAVTLVYAMQGIAVLVVLARTRRLFGWLPAPPWALGVPSLYAVWFAVWDVVDCAWIVVFVALVLGRYRTARVTAAAAAIAPALVALLPGQLTGAGTLSFGWPLWVLQDLVPVLAMAAFHRDAPPAARRPWLLALPVGYLLLAVPLRAVQATSYASWLPDGFLGLCCLLAALACLVHAPRAWSRRADGSGVWSLTLTLLAAYAGAYQIALLLIYDLPYPAAVKPGLAELLIVVAAVTLVAPDAARAQAAGPAPPPYPRPE